MPRRDGASRQFLSVPRRDPGFYACHDAARALPRDQRAAPEFADEPVVEMRRAGSAAARHVGPFERVEAEVDDDRLWSVSLVSGMHGAASPTVVVKIPVPGGADFQYHSINFVNF